MDQDSPAGSPGELATGLALDAGGHWYRVSPGQSSTEARPRDGRLRIGVVAPKNTESQARWLASLLGYMAEPYRRERWYDVVCFFNVTNELRFLRAHTDCRIVAVALEPRITLPQNYEPLLLRECDLYLGYRNFAGKGFSGEFRVLRFPATTCAEIDAVFEESLEADRTADFCMFASHDPNFRRVIAEAMKAHNAILGGPLFQRRVSNKLSIQRRCKYEVITESDINDYYVSEKVAQAMLGGCVPVYYGCTEIERQAPAGLIVTLREADLRGDSLPAVLRQLLQREVLALHQARLREMGREYLRRSCTFEENVVGPINAYLDRLADGGFRSKHRSWQWRARMMSRRVRLPEP